MTREIAQVETPIGAFRAIVVDGAVRNAMFVEDDAAEATRVRRDSSGVDLGLAGYFAGGIDALEATR